MRLPALLVLVSLACAQQAPEPPKKARMEGSVVSLTGEPVPRAQVRLAGAPSVQNGQLVQAQSYSATADDAGKFAIENIEPATNLQLTAQRPGFVNARYGARSATGPATPLSLEAGQSLKGLTITMTPQGVISGRVTDAAGDPVQGVLVALMRRGYQRGVRQLVPANTSQTNDQGEYRIANLAPGRYYVVAQGRGLAEALGATTGANTQGSMGNVATYYPNGTDARSAAPLDIAAGQDLRGIEIRLQQARVFSVRGKVISEGGAPAGPGSIVLAAPKSSSTADILSILTRSQSPVRAEGAFEIRGLVPGQYTIQAVSTQTGQARSMGRMDVNITDQDVTGIVFPLTGGLTLSGVMRLEGGDIKTLLPAAQSGAQTAANTLTLSAAAAGIAIAGGRLTVGLVESAPSPLSSATPGQIKDDGTFVLEGVAPSKYFLNVAGLPAGVYVKSARVGGTDVTLSEVDLSSGSGGTLDILLSNKAADVIGNVRGEKSDSGKGVMVTLWTRDADGGSPNNGIRTTTTDQNGSFQFKNLRPGVYYTAAWEDIDQTLATARDFVNLVTSEATKLEIAEGGHVAAEVKLVPAAKIKAAEEKLP